MTTIGYCLVASPEHRHIGHPEGPGRLAHFQALAGLPIAERLLRLEASPASLDVIGEIHTAAYLDRLRAVARQGPSYLDYGDTYITPDSFDAARGACGGVLAVVDAVLDSQAKSGFALVRPPGHHATAERAMGFCLLNNVAIAARHLQARGLERIAIIDFDVHHGNGTGEIFYADPSVLYVSTHQEGIFPGTGDIAETGKGDGIGFTINIPLPAGCGDQGFGQVFEAIVLPAIRRFEAEFLLISAGFDAHWKDPLAGLQLSCTGYFHLASQLLYGLDPRSPSCCFVLEGGYAPEALYHSVVSCLYAAADAGTPRDPIGPPPIPEPDVQARIQAAAEVHGL